ncbi:MAG TPA: cation-transporting P-type ATPase [Nitrososphaerales archaeon]|nr:cation-transporting P-type ATPase [Nitrososphaerales archaeon]
MKTEEKTLQDLVQTLNPNFSRGLTEAEAEARLGTYGPNSLYPKRKGGWWGFLAFLKEPMIWLLGAASLVYVFLGDTFDAAVCAVAVIPIGVTDVIIEFRTDETLRRLDEMGEPRVTVVRGGTPARILPEGLVPGDRLVLREGELVMADSAVVDSSNLQLDESSLSGESIPVQKSPQPQFSDEVFANAGTVFAGTRVLSGSATCLVVKTAQQTQYGRIGKSLATTKGARTGLQKDIDRVVKLFGAGAVLLSLALIPISLLVGNSLSEAILAAISLAIAAIPEELPVVFTIFLAFGMIELSRNHALVKRLPAVEALGGVSVVCTDKTGTLTTGVMSLEEVATDGRRGIDEFSKTNGAEELMMHAAMACEKDPFDYMEGAIYDVAERMGSRERMKGWNLVRDYPFDTQGRYVAHVWESRGTYLVCVKGSVEGVLALCSTAEAEKQRALEFNAQMGDEGTRVLAVAYKRTDVIGTQGSDCSDLTYDGLLGFYDPLKEGARLAVEEAQRAGVRVIMLTGDHKSTAHAIAHKVGLAHDQVVEGRELEEATDQEYLKILQTDNVFCRVTPEHKLKIVEGLQTIGYSVAVTGDGVNDSPALKKADIGVAMGRRGTEVAKEAASLVLLDDDFKTMVGAIRNGRRIYDNLSKAFGYLILTHAPIFFAALLVPILKLPLLLLPIEIVILELVLHPVVSLVFEAQPAEPGTMSRPPRSSSASIMNRRDLVRIVLLGFVIFLLSLIGYVVGFAFGYPEAHARALGFTFMFLGQLFVVPTELTRGRTSLAVFRQNRRAVWITLLTVVPYLLLLYVPGLAAATKLSALDATDWLIIVFFSAVTITVAELSKKWGTRTSPKRLEAISGSSDSGSDVPSDASVA